MSRRRNPLSPESQENCVLPGGGIRLTPALAYAAGTDAGNRSMRTKWPAKAWDEEDYNVAADTTNRLLDILYPEVAAHRKKMGHV